MLEFLKPAVERVRGGAAERARRARARGGAKFLQFQHPLVITHYYSYIEAIFFLHFQHPKVIIKLFLTKYFQCIQSSSNVLKSLNFTH